MSTDHSALRQKLDQIAQSHVLRFWDSLDEGGRNKLASQLYALDLDAIADLVQTQVKKKATIPLPKEIKPVQAYPHPSKANAEQRKLYADAEKRGGEMLRQGKV